MRRCLSTGIFSNSSPESLVLRSRTVADSAIVIVWLPSPDVLILKVIWASLPVSALSAMADNRLRGCRSRRGGVERACGIRCSARTAIDLGQLDAMIWMIVNRKTDSKNGTAQKTRIMSGRSCGGESQRLGGEVDRGTWGRQKLGAGPLLGQESEGRGCQLRQYR